MPQHPYTTVYDLDYFSGSQCQIFIGDVLVDEVTSLEYRTMQDKRPIYGYASQLWDDCAAGQVVVQGAFTINYKEQGYLWTVLRRYFEYESSTVGLPGNNQITDSALLSKQRTLEVDSKGNVIPGAINNRPLVGSHGTRISRANIERLIQGEATTGERYNFYHDLASYATTQVSKPRDKIFEDIMEVFEDQIWGVDSTNQGLNSQIRRTDDNAFDGFDIYVVFGNYATLGANHTVQKIIDVRLTSQGKSIQIDGLPVQEQYTFLGQTVA